MKIMELEWPDELPANSDCRYDHIIYLTSIGRILITWKSWKERPSYTIEFHNLNYFNHEYSLQNAKNTAKYYFEQIINLCMTVK